MYMYSACSIAYKYIHCTYLHVHIYTCKPLGIVHSKYMEIHVLTFSFMLSLSSLVHLVCDAWVEVLWLLCIVYVIGAQLAELPW